jgi:chromosome segregation ATPase
MRPMMKLNFTHKIITIFILALMVGSLVPQTSFAAEKKDKAAKRQALMMQKMKQDMEAEKATMQAQFDAQKKTLEEQLLAKNTELEKTNSALATSQRKVKKLGAELSKTQAEKTAVETKLTDTQATLDSTKNTLSDLQGVHAQALADLKFNDNQRKTISANLADTTKQLNTCAVQNAKLHQFGTDLIQIYDKPSRYEAVMRKEKFFQLKRVELENILQNQQDKLDEQRFSAGKSAN